MKTISRIVKGTIVLSEDIKLLKRFTERSKGLMFAKKLRKNQALVFENTNESVNQSMLHMFFVFYRIDIVWLDKGLEVIDMRENVRPFTALIRPRKPAKYVIEFPAGKIRETGLKIGDRIKFF